MLKSAVAVKYIGGFCLNVIPEGVKAFVTPLILPLVEGHHEAAALGQNGFDWKIICLQRPRPPTATPDSAPVFFADQVEIKIVGTAAGRNGPKTADF